MSHLTSKLFKILQGVEEGSSTPVERNKFFTCWPNICRGIEYQVWLNTNTPCSILKNLEVRWETQKWVYIISWNQRFVNITGRPQAASLKLVLEGRLWQLAQTVRHTNHYTALTWASDLNFHLNFLDWVFCQHYPLELKCTCYWCLLNQYLSSAVQLNYANLLMNLGAIDSFLLSSATVSKM